MMAARMPGLWSLLPAASLPAMVVVILASGCQGAPPAVQHTPIPSPTPPQQAAWQSCGASSVPPHRILAAPADLPAIRNRTNGQVSDADARRWVAGLLREQAIETWAETSLQAGLLQGACLGDPSAQGNLFGTEIQLIQQARQASGQMVIHQPVITGLELVAVPAQAQDRIQGLGGAPSAYALITHGQGPAEGKLVFPGRREQTFYSLGPNEAFYTFFGGEYRADSQGLGPIWYQKAFMSCYQEFLRPVCGI
jgi:hypothetical protein